MPISTRKPNSAFRFVHPDLDEPTGASAQSEAPAVNHAGLRLEPRGSLAMVTGDAAVRQSLLLLLSTRPGERIMRPTYGCNLSQLVFAPNDDTTAAIAIHHVRRAVQRWEPRIIILKLDAQRDPYQPSLLVITLQYQVRSSQNVDQVELSLDLAGEEI